VGVYVVLCNSKKKSGFYQLKAEAKTNSLASELDFEKSGI